MATLSELITTLKGKMLPLAGGTSTGALTAPSVSITKDNAKVKGKNIVRSVNGTSAGADGNVTLNTFITQTGDRESLAGYETISSSANAITVNATSADDQICTGAVTITVSDGSNGQTWQKNVTITNAGATISPGSKWKWAGGKAPELKANSLLVCKWVGVVGVLSLVTTE